MSFGFYILISKTEKDLWVDEKQKKCFNGINVCWLTNSILLVFGKYTSFIFKGYSQSGFINKTVASFAEIQQNGIM